jgi:hypothetical protein
VTIRTGNGGHAAVGTELCPFSTTRQERAAILEREERVAAWRKTLPKRKRPEHTKPGPVSWVAL